MRAAAKLGGFLGVLALLFAGGSLAGEAFGPEAEDRGRAGAHGVATAAAGDAAAHGAGDTESAAHGAGDAGAGAHPVRGLGVAENGLRVVVGDPELRRGATERLAFRVVDEDGRTVRDFDLEHEKRMHLIVARRDLTGFQHLHPRQRRDGSWSTAIEIAEPGSYRMFADFSHEGRASTLASDLRVDGDADLFDLPAPAVSATSDLGYGVRLDSGRPRSGDEARLRFAVTDRGRPVATEPYLGAGGHLVALREGDLAFLHVHPTGAGTTFEATFPTAGRYRLFLQFKHQVRVHTAAFTIEVPR